MLMTNQEHAERELGEQLQNALASGDHDEVAYIMTIIHDAFRDGLVGWQFAGDSQGSVLRWGAKHA